jgi:hypothetical protein
VYVDLKGGRALAIVAATVGRVRRDASVVLEVGELRRRRRGVDAPKIQLQALKENSERNVVIKRIYELR